MRSKGTNMSMSAKKIELAAATQQDPRWASVVARSTEADGKFFYSVRTTGIYCRPSCAARRARPENVRFHATRAEAEAAGFRAVQALQARPTVTDRAACRQGHPRLPSHRDFTKSPDPRRAGGGSRASVSSISIASSRQSPD